VLEAGDDLVRIGFRPSALVTTELASLSEWTEGHGHLELGSENWLVARRTELTARALHSELAAHLAAALEAHERPRPPIELMGVLNVTPDSFSDGGLHFDPDRAVEAGLQLAAEGATWLDVGGESTRPGARPVPVEEELGRVLPVLRALAQEGCAALSVDTRHAQVAEAALEVGTAMVNDVGAGLDDDHMLEVIRGSECRYVMMHRQGDPARMQRAPRYEDPVADVGQFLRQRTAAALEAGIELERLLVDPGIGFGKALEHNLKLLGRLSELRSLGLPLLVGPSRKSFIGHVTGAQHEADWARREARDDPSLRLGGTAAAITFCVRAGVDVLRVHDVAVMAEASAVAAAIDAHSSRPEPDPC
jgi:dihydropteroate synthase